MNIIDMSAGSAIAWTLDGLLLTFAGGLTIDLDAETQDVGRMLDVYLDASGDPTLEGGGLYAAILVLLPRFYAKGGEDAPFEPLPPNPRSATLYLFPLRREAAQ